MWCIYFSFIYLFLFLSSFIMNGPFNPIYLIFFICCCWFSMDSFFCIFSQCLHMCCFFLKKNFLLLNIYSFVYYYFWFYPLFVVLNNFLRKLYFFSYICCEMCVLSFTRVDFSSWHIENVPLRNPSSCFHERKSKRSSGLF